MDIRTIPYTREPGNLLNLFRIKKIHTGGYSGSLRMVTSVVRFLMVGAAWDQR